MLMYDCNHYIFVNERGALSGLILSSSCSEKNLLHSYSLQENCVFVCVKLGGIA